MNRLVNWKDEKKKMEKPTIEFSVFGGISAWGEIVLKSRNHLKITKSSKIPKNQSQQFIGK